VQALSSAKNWLSTLKRAMLALHLDQTRLTRLDLSCPRWPGDQHCEITFVPIIPVSFGENEGAASRRCGHSRSAKRPQRRGHYPNKLFLGRRQNYRAIERCPVERTSAIQCDLYPPW
jgi:hypothetical protein